MPIVTISRGTLSGGSKLAELLGSRLGYRVLSREVIVEAAKTYGISEEKLEEGMHHPPGLWARFTGHAERYVLAIQATLAELVEEDDAVYHGLAGQYLLKGVPCVLKVRLIAPFDYRVRAAIEQLGYSREQARDHIHKVDQEREVWVRRLYGAEWSDATHYDLVLNVGGMSHEVAAETIYQVLQSDEYKRTPESSRALRDFALATRVRANLRFRSDFSEIDIDVSARDGVVHVSGGPAVQRNREAIARFVEAIRGVEEVFGIDAETAPPEERARFATARQVMIPIVRYPHIAESATIREALVALGSSAVRLEDGHFISPRYLLVLNDAYALVGIVGRRDLLRGLTPGLQKLESAMETVQGVFPVHGPGYEANIAGTSLFSEAATKNSHKPLSAVMAPVRGVVKADDSLGLVVSTMLEHRVDLVPVMEGASVIGVMLMTEIFDLAAQYTIEHGGAPPHAAGGT